MLDQHNMENEMTVRSIFNQLADRVVEASSLVKQVAELRREVAELRGIISDLIVARERAEKERDEAIAQRDEERMQREEWEQKHSALLGDHGRLRESHTQLFGSFESMRESERRAQERIAELQAELDSERNLNQALGDENKALNYRVDLVKGILSDMNQSVEKIIAGDRDYERGWDKVEVVSTAVTDDAVEMNKIFPEKIEARAEASPQSDETHHWGQPFAFSAA